MFRTLYSKLTAVLFVLFALLAMAFVGMTVYTTGMYQQEVSQKLNRDIARSIAAEKTMFREDNTVNREALAELFHMLMVINPSIEIYLLDPVGNILTFSAEPGKVKREQVDLAPIRVWLAGAATIPYFGDDPRDPGGQKVFSVARIPEQGELKGYLYVILGGEQYDSAARKFQGSYILKLSTLMIAAGLFCTLLASLLFFALLTGRLTGWPAP